MGSIRTTDVSVLGTGAIGTRLTEVLIDAGTMVTVWNRTHARTARLVGRGATAASSALDAAAASPLVLLAFTDYAAVTQILDTLGDGIAGRTVATLTTGTPEEARATARRVESSGARYLDGAVQTSPDAIGTEAAVFLFSGAQESFEEHSTVLERLGSSRFVGADPAAAAVHDLALFGLWYDAQIAHLRALDTVRSSGIDVESFAGSAARQLQHVVSTAEETACEVATRSYPRGPADLTEHVPLLGKLVAIRRNHRLGDGQLPHIQNLVQQRIEAGHGHEGLNGILD